MLLSICMPTLNRASYIGQTLDSILPQLGENMEVVIVDGGSGDGTAEVVSQRSALCPRIRYQVTSHIAEGIPKPSNAGYDHDCDLSVQLAQGEYCWLLPDDDLLVPDALERVSKYLETGKVLVVANSEVRSNDLSKVLATQRLTLVEDVTFERGEADRILEVVGQYLSYAGGVIVRRDWWLSKNRKQHFGSGFVHIGTLFQDPDRLDAVAIARPLILLRYGNALWNDRAFNIWMSQWPKLIWSLPLGEKAKNAVTPKEPWRKLGTLALFRARGAYRWADFRGVISRESPPWRSVVKAAFVAAIPGALLNLLALLRICLKRGRGGMEFLDLWQSRYNILARFIRTV
jgi:abequosyltransferase